MASLPLTRPPHRLGNPLFSGVFLIFKTEQGSVHDFFYGSLLIIITIIISFAGVGFGHMIRRCGEFLLRSSCRVCLEKLEGTRLDGEGSFVTLF